MNPRGSNSNDRARLSAIARRAMVERNLEPDFPSAAKQDLAAIIGPAVGDRIRGKLVNTDVERE